MRRAPDPRLWLLAVVIGMLGSVRTHAAVPDAVRGMPWRREVIVPRIAPGDTADTWYLIEADSLLAAVTDGDLAKVRLVDTDGEPVPTSYLEPTWPELRSVPVATAALTWQPSPGTPGLFSTVVALPAGDHVAVAWDANDVRDVHLSGRAVRPARPGHPLDPFGALWTDEELPRPWPAGGQRVWTYREADTTTAILSVRVPDGHAPPAVVIRRLRERTERLRAVSFAPPEVTYQGTRFTASVLLANGPRAVARLVVERAPNARSGLVAVELRGPDGTWRRVAADRGTDVRPEVAAAKARAETLLVRPQPRLATAVRLSYAHAEPPNPPFTLREISEVPPALAFAPGARTQVWLAYGAFAAVGAPGIAPAMLRTTARLVPVVLGPATANPWFRERTLGATWLQRRPAVLTVAMVAILAVVALLLVKPAPREPRR